MNAAISEIAQSFARDGFVVVPNMFRRDEVKLFKEGIQKILQEVRQESEGEDSPKKHRGRHRRLCRAGRAQRYVPASRAR